MHETSQSIISLFRKTGSELSTSQILNHINSDYSKLKQNIQSKQDIEAKRKIAQIHRKALHHLNKLVEMDILAIVKHGEKGEKFFSLKIRENEEILEISPKYKKRIIITNPITPAMPIEGYEQKGVVIKYEPATWIDRLSSVIVFSEKIKDKNRLHNILTENIFPVVNDAINLESFETIINEQDVVDFIEKINLEAEDYGKIINITIDLACLKNMENFNKLLNFVSKNKLKQIKFIFVIDSLDIDEHFKTLISIIDIFSRGKRDLYIRNKKMQRAPYFIGRAGPYSFMDKEWQLAEELKKNMICLGCSQSSVIVDVNKFYEEHGLDIEKFSQLMFNISKSMLSANSIQRRKSADCFRSVNYLNEGYAADFLMLSRNYIRFWNFGLHQPGMNQEFVLNMINEAKKKIDGFASAEETIYKSCGMTTRFKLGLAPAFETAAKLSQAKYSHLEIRNLEDLHKKDIKKRLLEREITSKIFDGGNEVTFHYLGNLDPEAILRQISVILSSYKLPLFNYDFSNIRGNLKLKHFFE